MSETTSRAKSAFRALRTALAVSGILAVLGGIVILVWPGKSAAIVTAIFASYLVVAGIVYVAIGFFARLAGGWTRVGHVLLGLLYLVGGIIAFTNLSVTTLALVTVTVIFIGISWIVDGIVALTLLRDASSRAWTILYAIVSIVGGVVVLASPALAGLTLWWILGTTLVVLGVVQIIRAITLAKDATALKAAIAEDLGAA